LLIAFLLTLVALALSLLLGILITMVWAGVHHATPNLHLVYRRIAPAVAGTVGFIVLIVASIVEARYYRQAKALAGIERMSHGGGSPGHLAS
jgi:hypothetical protein